MENICERVLIDRAQNNPDKFGELYDLYYSTILNYMYRRVFDSDLAEELTSNTFFNVMKALPDYQHKTSFKAWIYRIATNEINMFWRSKRNRRKRENGYYETQQDRIYFFSPETESEESRKERIHQFALIKEMLEQLPDRYRTALILRFFEELTYEDIAQVLGKRTGTVKSLVHRGLKRMRILIEQHKATFSRGVHYYE